MDPEKYDSHCQVQGLAGQLPSDRYKREFCLVIKFVGSDIICNKPKYVNMFSISLPSGVESPYGGHETSSDHSDHQ